MDGVNKAMISLPAITKGFTTVTGLIQIWKSDMTTTRKLIFSFLKVLSLANTILSTIYD